MARRGGGRCAIAGRRASSMGNPLAVHPRVPRHRHPSEDLVAALAHRSSAGSGRRLARIPGPGPPRGGAGPLERAARTDRRRPHRGAARSRRAHRSVVPRARGTGAVDGGPGLQPVLEPGHGESAHPLGRGARKGVPRHESLCLASTRSHRDSRRGIARRSHAATLFPTRTSRHTSSSTV